ncbi:hypothetical protein [Paenibacillus sp. V4I5]|uniref:hypothetical protein n=1 Tax=Paenibacillus sp. V4I5 TaxID=3042306 RepID=UPI002790A581|nr:hypothetical protein [Paenibacillus sp. V4I5]MDQ0914599.1 hypothetical protein [Paenibacillus sp. V4I5]
MFRKIILMVTLVLLPIVAYAETPAQLDHPLAPENMIESELSEMPKMPIYKPNSHADKSIFITKEEAIEQARIKENGGILRSVELMTWDQFSREAWNKPNSMADRANDRMVWVVKVDYPKGIDTKGGYFFNANQTVVFDAETGQIFGGITSGDPK